MSHSTRIVLIAAVIVIGASAVYLTRPPAAPSGPTESAELPAPTSTSPTAEAMRFRIAPGASSVATFTLGEVLRGTPTTVIGKTDQVAGDIVVDLAHPSSSEVGMIRINARTLATDSRNRDGMISRFILQSAKDEYEYLTFVPKSLGGLPSAAKIGVPIVFTITGDLTIAGVTRSVTWNATVTVSSDQELEGSAAATVRRSDFKLTIPSVPSVAEVTDDVSLKLTFTAARVN